MKNRVYAGLAVLVSVILLGSFVLAGCAAPKPTPTPTPTTPTPTPTPTPTVIKLKYATSYVPDNHPSVRDDYWFNLVEKKTAGRVKIERYWAGTLGSMGEMLALVNSGASDFVSLSPLVQTKQLPLHAWLNDVLWRNSSEAVAGMNALEFDIPASAAILAEEGTRNGLKVLAWSSGTSHGVMFRPRVTRLADFQGKKIRGGGVRDVGIRQFGGVPVTVVGAEVYDSISKGVIDGSWNPVTLQATYRTWEVASSFIYVGRDGGESPLAINLARWNSLPTDVRQAMLSATKETTEYMGTIDVNINKDFLAACQAKGLTITKFEQLSLEEQQTMDTVLDRALGVDWMSNMEKTGLGSQAKTLYDCYQQVVKQYRK